MSIIENKKAFHDYFIEERFEAGLVLEGWEVKSIRAGRVQLKERYVVLIDGAFWLIGCHISPLPTASTHIHPDPTRRRKLLLARGATGSAKPLPKLAAWLIALPFIAASCPCGMRANCKRRSNSPGKPQSGSLAALWH